MGPPGKLLLLQKARVPGNSQSPYSLSFPSPFTRVLFSIIYLPPKDGALIFIFLVKKKWETHKVTLKTDIL